MLPDEIRAGTSEERPEDDCHDDRVVERAHDGDEVRNDIQREGQVGNQRSQEQLVAPRDPPVPYETGAEDCAIGDEGRPCSGIPPAAHDEQHDDERDVDRQPDCRADAEPAPRAHHSTIRGDGEDCRYAR